MWLVEMDISTNHMSKIWINRFNPLTAAPDNIRFFIFYYHLKYQLLNMLKIKHIINQQDLKIVHFHFVKSE